MPLTQIQLETLVRQFAAWGDVLSVRPCGSGHIHDTYRVASNLAGTAVSYLLQRINHHVFTKPDEVMSNVVRVTEHLRTKRLERGQAEVSRQVMTFLPTRSRGWLHRDEAGNFWRMALFIENAHTCDKATTPEQARTTAAAFAQFAGELTDLPGPRLFETIPNFHHAPARWEAFERAVQTDSAGRARDVRAEIEFIEARRAMCGHLIGRMTRGEIPERITHNDCKINNVLLDARTGQGLCVIDLDTVMPGLALYDFGDMVRTAAASADEDEVDLSRVHIRLEMFEALVRGYTEQAPFLTAAEREELVFAGRLITYVQAMRFLTDYLLGDVYYKIHRPAHNLDRARTQIKLVQSMEARDAEMRRITR